MPSNINTQDYWDQRFASGNWEESRGRWQTAAFAQQQVQMLRLSPSFNGSLLDFGSGLGDAFPVYRKRFPFSKLIGVDHSEAAIAQCQESFSHIAKFIQGGCDSVPQVDVIIASNVLEHISDDKSTVKILLSKCSELYVFVPYMETPLCSEHVNYYDEQTFSAFDMLETQVFCSRGWTEYGRALWVGVYLKNLLRPFFGKPLAHRRKQIMFRIRGELAVGRDVLSSGNKMFFERTFHLPCENGNLETEVEIKCCVF